MCIVLSSKWFPSLGISYPVEIFKMPNSLVDAVNTVTLDDHLRRRIKSKALLVRNFSWEKNSLLTEKVYKEVNRY
jgi:glycosyltransferase involved in cell wall biosynthesis